MRVLDLFSGIGGFSLAAEWCGWETVAFCEQDQFCQRVLEKHWPDVPIFNDVKTLDAKSLKGAIDLICGGFPCQGFSVAGRQKGKEDDRYLWPEMFRIIKECRPTWVVGENVTGIIKLALDDVLADLESEGYACQAFNIPACGVNAPHKRERIWVVAYRKLAGAGLGASGDSGQGRQPSGSLESEILRQENWASSAGGDCSSRENVADTDTAGLQGGENAGDSGGDGQEPDDEFARRCAGASSSHPPGTGLPDWAGGEMGQPGPLTEFERPDGESGKTKEWEAFSVVRRVDDGVSNRVDRYRRPARDRARRLKALGNAIVPAVVYEIFKAIEIIDGKRESSQSPEGAGS